DWSSDVCSSDLWEKGLQVIEDTMTSYGIDNATILLRDGSGMSHKNLIPASEISNLLFAIQSEDWFHLFEESLPIAGEPGKLVGGTLRYRMTAARSEEHTSELQ